MRNPLIFLGRVVGSDCCGHHVGLTYKGRLIFYDHASVEAVEAESALAQIGERSRHSQGCYQVLRAARNAPRERQWRYRLDAMSANRRRLYAIDEIRRLKPVPTCTPLYRLMQLTRAGLLEQAPLRLWELLRQLP